MAEFRMPSLGADMESGVLLEWLVRPGDRVRKGDIVAVVDTAKAAVDVECFDSGTVERLLVEPGTRVPVGTPLATIATDVAGEPSPEPSRPQRVTPVRAAPTPVEPTLPRAGGSPVTSPLVRRLAAKQHVDLEAVHGTGYGGRVTHADISAATHPAPVGPNRLRISPMARRLAAELEVNLATVTGTGPAGAIQAEDVRRAGRSATAPPGKAVPPAGAAPAAPAMHVVAVGAAPPVDAGPVQTAETAEAAARPAGVAGRAGAPPAREAERTTAMREAIAALMARSKREIPHYYLTETVDLAAAVDWLSRRNRALPVPQRLIAAAVLLKAAARAARAVPDLNGFFVNGRFERAAAVHLGVAISLRGGGLVAPAIHDADRLELSELMARLKDLVLRTRAGRLRNTELSDPTITVSNLGEQGVESILGVIYPPQVALVGFGRITERPWAIDGLIGVRPLVTVSLAADHRVTDGATGARYLATVNQLLQRPEEL